MKVDTWHTPESVEKGGNCGGVTVCNVSAKRITENRGGSIYDRLIIEFNYYIFTFLNSCIL
jgi:hypothetical protein